MKIRNWPIFIFVALYHIAIIALIPTAIEVFSWGAFWFFLVTYIIGGVSITAGYHRLFSHKSYNANPFYEWTILFSS
jgi:stearoyl-CoA desaturase (delta-9 desaturase)